MSVSLYFNQFIYFFFRSRHQSLHHRRCILSRIRATPNLSTCSVSNTSSTIWPKTRSLDHHSNHTAVLSAKSILRLCGNGKNRVKKEIPLFTLLQVFWFIFHYVNILFFFSASFSPIFKGFFLNKYSWLIGNMRLWKKWGKFRIFLLYFHLFLGLVLFVLLILVF